MSDDTTNLVLDLLRAIRVEVVEVKERLDRVEVRLAAIEGHLGNLMLSMAGQNSEIDKIKKRPERVERRLELSDQA